MELPFPYQPLAGFRDEMADDAVRPRPHWAGLVESLRALGHDELSKRWGRAQRIIRENGVTYNVYGDPLGIDRPWALDLLPLVLDAAEWNAVGDALAQRARLLERVLADLYGPQQLLREGLLPAEIVLAHPGFLRPCHGLVPAEERFLHLYAADLARAPDGGWWVLGDRTQAPSGAGYALENRIVLSRTLPEAFRESRAERLAPFFRTLRETLRRLAPGKSRNPRVVLLTPGPYNETYFEHAYLARYLGFDLAEGADLTVRDRALFLKTLGGLEPVDVLLRRVDDVFCDPLSLRSDSALGVAGLVNAVRAGNVVVANALGSGLVESPALLPFLPLLARTLLGEELLLPSVATWWCGHADALEQVVSNLSDLVVKPAFPGRHMDPIFGARLSAEERHALIVRIRARPYAYVAQEQVALSTAPVWEGTGAQPRHVVLRAYCAAAEQGYHVLPGGLTRVAVSRDSLVVSMQRGGGSKDTWVRAEGPVSAVTLLRATEIPVELRRGGAELPSRVADNLFWLGRYLERAEGAARLARGIVSRLSNVSSPGGEIPPLLRALSHQIGAEVGVAGSLDAAALDREMFRVLFADETPRGLRASVARLHKLARVLRDQMSLRSWRVTNRLYEDVSGVGTDGLHAASGAWDLLERVIVSLSAMSGLVAESMTRGQGWRFADMGRRIERGSHAAALLAAALVRPLDDEEPLLEVMLEIADSAIAHRRRYLGALQAGSLLDLLLMDETNPRSVAFQLATLSEHVERLPRPSGSPARSAEERIALSLLTRVRLADPIALARTPDGGKRHAARGAARARLRRAARPFGRADPELSHARPAGAPHRLSQGIPCATASDTSRATPTKRRSPCRRTRCVCCRASCPTSSCTAARCASILRPGRFRWRPTTSATPPASSRWRSPTSACRSKLRARWRWRRRRFPIPRPRRRGSCGATARAVTCRRRDSPPTRWSSSRRTSPSCRTSRPMPLLPSPPDARCWRRRSSSWAGSIAISSTRQGRRRSIPGSRSFWSIAAASARTSRISASAACAPSACRPATSAATCGRSRRPARRDWSAPMPPTPGWRSIAGRRAGSTSIRPTTGPPARGT